MSELNYNQIFDGVSLALHKAFPSARIHSGAVEQGLNSGDFNVLPVTTSETAQIGARAQRSISFDVIYYPPEEGSREACLDMQSALSGVIGAITTPNGDILHCLKFESNITDDALHCVVSYPHFVYSEKTGDAMEAITIT